MIGLRNRGALPSVVQDEFENLIARVEAFFLKEHNEDGTHITSPASLAVVPIGAEMAWPTDTAPTGWVFARGQQIARLKYKGYFDLVGTLYGIGDGSLTFNVPNIQGRTVYGKATAGTGSTLGGVFGSMDHTHTGPSHTHTGPSHTHTGPSHDHSFSDTSSSNGGHTHTFSDTTDAGNNADTAVALGGGALVSGNTHTHQVGGTTGSDGAHTHAVSGTTGTAGTGATGAAGTGDTGASGTGVTSTSNPPGIAQNWIIYVGVV